MSAPSHPARTAATLRRSLFLAAAGTAALALVASGCGSGRSSSSSATTTASTAATTSTTALAVSGNTCPQVVDESRADFYPIQGSFSAGYTAAGQKLSGDTASWAYVVKGDFAYSYWTAWYLYTAAGVPLLKIDDTSILPDSGSTNPFVYGNPILASPRSYTITFMPHTTPQSVVSSMRKAGKNVAVLPAVGSTPAASLVFRSYWSLANDGLGAYDRFGYGGPTNTPFPVIRAYLTDPATGELTGTPVDDCGAQSGLPERLWFDPSKRAPVVTFEHARLPERQEYADLPKWLIQTGSVSGTVGAEFAPAPVPSEVQFYRNNASKTPYADVQSAPPAGNPPDRCGGYVVANLPNDVVTIVHVPQVPTFPDYRGATAKTPNDSRDYQVSFYSVVIYGAQKQLDAVGTNENSQLGNRQLMQNADGSATVVLYPYDATQEQIAKIAAVVKANGWNLLRSGVQTAFAPNSLVIREKGQNTSWKNAISANDVTQGAPCPQSENPDLPLPQDPPSAQVTQFNGMGLTAPSGQNCPIDAFLSGRCLQDLQARLKDDGAAWSAKANWPTQRSP
jgi:hypothetical protein